MFNNTGAVVLGAGYGQLRSGATKVLEFFNGEMLIERGLSNAIRLGMSPVVVPLNPMFGEQVRTALKNRYNGSVEYVNQTDRKGPADAAYEAALLLKEKGVENFTVTFGDMPMITESHIRDITRIHLRDAADFSFSYWVFEPEHPYSARMNNYAHYEPQSECGGGNNAFPVIRQYQGMPSEGAHVLSSVYVLKTDWFLKVFDELPWENKGDRHHHERHLTRLVEVAALKNSVVRSMGVDDPLEILGVNNWNDLHALNAICQTASE